MRSPTRSHLIALAVALALASGAVGPADKKGPQTIGELKSRQVEVRKDTQVSATSSKAMENYKRFLELQQTDPELRARATELGFRLIDTKDYSAHGKLTEFLTSHHIPAPDNEFATASLPKPDYLEAMIKEVGDGCPADR